MIKYLKIKAQVDRLGKENSFSLELEQGKESFSLYLENLGYIGSKLGQLGIVFSQNSEESTKNSEVLIDYQYILSLIVKTLSWKSSSLTLVST